MLQPRFHLQEGFIGTSIFPARSITIQRWFAFVLPFACRQPDALEQQISRWDKRQARKLRSNRRAWLIESRRSLRHGSVRAGRSEEHTSELQSLRHLVCR